MAAQKTAVLLILMGTTVRLFAEGYSRNSHFSYFETFKNKRLMGYVFKRFDSPSLLSCGQECLRNTWCSSTNFKLSSNKKSIEGTCELNKHDISVVNERSNFADQEETTFTLLLKVCQKKWALHSRSCYLTLYTSTQNWTEARRICQSHGGDLPIIRSADENNFILNLIQNQKSVQDMGVWIGLYRKPENEFYWIDDTPVAGQFSLWADGKPNNHSNREKCANMFAGKYLQSGKWNDIICNFRRENQLDVPFVLCQKGLL